MSSNFFSNSKLSKLVLHEVNCKKLEAPSGENPLIVNISVGLQINDEKIDDGYEVSYNLGIKCEEEGDEKLFSFECEVKAIYQIEGPKKSIIKGFEENYLLFLREMYNMTREDINSILDKMNIDFQLPLSLPEELKLKSTKKGKPSKN